MMIKEIAYWVLLCCLITLSACGNKEKEEKRCHAISANEAARQIWQKSRKAVEIELQSKGNFPPEKICVYAQANDATEDESMSMMGTPFVRGKNGRTYLPEKSPVYTGDTTATYKICYPIRQGLGIYDKLEMKHPFEEWMFGTEISRATKDASMRIVMRLEHGTAKIRLRLESDDMRRILTGASLSGSNIYTKGEYMPYTGIWDKLGGENEEISLTKDLRMSRYQYIDFVVPPSPHAGDVKINIKADSKEYSVRTTLPRLGRGEMTQLNMALNDGVLRIMSSWVEAERRTDIKNEVLTDTIAVGDYLESDGKISRRLTENAVATVIETDGRHGKAVALLDIEGLKCFGRGKPTGERTFATIDNEKKEGYINPSNVTDTDKSMRIAYIPDMQYPEDCAIGYTDGCQLSQRLQGRKKDWGHDEMISCMSRKDGTYIPSFGEMAKLYYMLNPYKGEAFAPEGFARPDGVYATSSESSEDCYYVIDMDSGMASGNVSKITRMKLRMFYLF